MAFASAQHELLLACLATFRGATVQPDAGLPLSAGVAHRKKKEQLCELALPEVIHEVLLRIRAQASDVAVLGTALLAQCKDALSHIL